MTEEDQAADSTGLAGDSVQPQPGAPATLEGLLGEVPDAQYVEAKKNLDPPGEFR